MDFLISGWDYLMAVPGVRMVGTFLIVLTVLVFIHELGHYLVARWNGVRIEVFSIGFGPELFGWHDRAGTRWKFSAVPLGGYVKMYGDADASSLPSDSLGAMSAVDREFSFHHKRLGQRIAVVAAGPAANFLFAIVLLATIFATYGQQFIPPDVGDIAPGSAAEEAGFKVGDRVVQIDGQSIDSFEGIRQTVTLNAGTPMQIVVRRDAGTVVLSATPHGGLLGIRPSGVEYVRYDPATAVWRAVGETWKQSAGTLNAIRQMIAGTRTTDELGGPLRIAQMSGEVAKGGIVAIVWFMAVLSINLGLINLFPVPVLDGGHLLFYVAEAIRGRPLGQQAQEYGFRIGLALVLTLMIFATWNDVVQIGIWKFIRGLVT